MALPNLTGKAIQALAKQDDQQNQRQWNSK
jgi:hypothetical protein